MNSSRINQKGYETFYEPTQGLQYDHKLFIYVVTVDNFSKFSLLKVQFFKIDDRKRKSKHRTKKFIKASNNIILYFFYINFTLRELYTVLLKFSLPRGSCLLLCSFRGIDYSKTKLRVLVVQALSNIV